MSEWKRIFLNRIWLGTAALSLLFSLVIYATAQSSRVGSSVLAYREHTNQWTQILSVVSPEDGLALLERENQTLQGWNTARMLVQLEEWQGQIVNTGLALSVVGTDFRHLPTVLWLFFHEYRLIP